MKIRFLRRRRQGGAQTAPAATAAPASAPAVLEYATDLELSASVGRGGKNLPEDVGDVQSALNAIKPCWGGPGIPLNENGKMDDATIKAITHIQTWHFGSGDGRINPGKATHAKIQQILDGYVDIFVAQEPSAPDDDATIGINKKWISEILTTSVSQMVERITAVLDSDNGKRIMQLVVIGHGCEGAQRIGPGDWDGTHHLMLQQWNDFNNPTGDAATRLAGRAEKYLALLKYRFHTNAVVSLCGCKVAAVSNEGWGVVDGKNLLRGVSRALGSVKVQAGTINQVDLTPGFEGTCVRCVGSICYVVTGGGLWGPTDNARVKTVLE